MLPLIWRLGREACIARLVDNKFSWVPGGHVWIQGDNIYASSDSRQFGPVPYGLVEGKILCRVWPLDGFGLLNH
ncbi:hypothetical protein NL676_027084 [Syzygium grande]|nr:hypothetical protein NL676_027084 [Syzygium grande]